MRPSYEYIYNNMFLISNQFLKVLLPVLVSLVAVSWIFFKILRLSLNKNLVDNPNARKLQKTPVPVMGGMAVFFGVLCSTLLSCCLFDCEHLIPIYIAMGLMLYVGILDDLLGLTPIIRLLIEICCIAALIFGGGGCVDSLHGLWGIGEFSWWIGVPLTIFAGVGIINAMNMIDGVNGLSSGLCVACASMFGVALYRGGDVTDAVLCFSMAAGLCPFIIHNMIGRTSKMFIGDAGTMVMGVLMSWCVIQVLRHDTLAKWGAYTEEGMCLIALVLAILSIPVMDTLRVMTMRMLHGRSPFSADKTHLHHILFKYSGSHSLTTFIEISLDFLVVIIWAITFKTDCSIEVQFYAVFLSAACLVWGLYFYMFHQDKHGTRTASRLRRWMVSIRQGDTNWWNRLQQYVDTPRGFATTGIEKPEEDENETKKDEDSK